MRIFAVITCVVVCAALVGGCGGGPAVDGTPAPPVTLGEVTTVAPTTTTTPAVLSKEEAAKRYLAIVKPYNVALEQLEKATNDGKPIAELRNLAQATATANETHVRELSAAAWPADVRPAVTALATASGEAQQHWLAAAQAKTRDALIKSFNAAAKASGGDHAKEIRRLLDLAKYNEGDYSG